MILVSFSFHIFPSGMTIEAEACGTNALRICITMYSIPHEKRIFVGLGMSKKKWVDKLLMYHLRRLKVC
jgi:hypothetical protein